MNNKYVSGELVEFSSNIDFLLKFSLVYIVNSYIHQLYVCALNKGYSALWHLKLNVRFRA
jgi:hypothetical protein